MEVLAPAGNREALEAAVHAGAHAVYLAGLAFGARASAGNFSDEALREVVGFCHARGVLVYVTVNTVLSDQELPEALNFIRFLCDIAVDAVLIQDLGLLRLVREAAPGLVVHASTQMTVMGEAGLALCETLGISRVVVPRELSCEELADVGKNSPVEIEAFVHGALCMSVSGQCYFSAALGGRSGNRGRCAQPCRLPFFSGTQQTGQHGLSLKDLSLLQHVTALKAAGVHSVKIEGRMKRPEYVTAAVTACRQAVEEGTVPAETMAELAAVFSRSGFTDGYFSGQLGAQMFGVRTHEDVKDSARALGKKSVRRREAAGKVPVTFSLAVADAITLTGRDRDGHECSAHAAAEPGVENLDEVRCVQQLKKTGATPFLAEAVSVPVQGVPLRIAALNALRREVLETLLKQRAHRPGIPFEMPVLAATGSRDVQRGLPVLRASFRDLAQVPEYQGSLTQIYVPLETNTQACLTHPAASRLGFVLPRALFGKAIQDGVRAQVLEKIAAGFSVFAVGGLDGLAICRGLKAEVHGLFSMNVYNSEALKTVQALGLTSTELSPELSGAQWRALRKPEGLSCGAMCYGRLPLMLTRNCPVQSAGQACKTCQGGHLTDRKGVAFPVRCRGKGTGHYTEVFNSVPTLVPRKDLWMADFALLRFTTETAVEAKAVLRAVESGELPFGPYSRALFRQGVE